LARVETRTVSHPTSDLLVRVLVMWVL